jgi:hypothetical protein
VHDGISWRRNRAVLHDGALGRHYMAVLQVDAAGRHFGATQQGGAALRIFYLFFKLKKKTTCPTRHDPPRQPFGTSVLTREGPTRVGSGFSNFTPLKSVSPHLCPVLTRDPEGFHPDRPVPPHFQNSNWKALYAFSSSERKET